MQNIFNENKSQINSTTKDWQGRWTDVIWIYDCLLEQMFDWEKRMITTEMVVGF